MPVVFSKVSPVCLARTLTSLALLNLCSLCSTFSFKVSPASDKSCPALLCVCSAALCSRLPQTDVQAPLCSSPCPVVLLLQFLSGLAAPKPHPCLLGSVGPLCSACFSSLCILLGTLSPGTEQG